MKSEQTYAINLDARFKPLDLIELDPIVAATTDPWFNQTLCQVNDAAVRLGVLAGEFHWHKHDEQDEFFLVLDGRLLIDVDGRGTVELSARQGLTVPKGVLHRPRAPQKTVVLMIERADVKPTGD